MYKQKIQTPRKKVGERLVGLVYGKSFFPESNGFFVNSFSKKNIG